MFFFITFRAHNILRKNITFEISQASKYFNYKYFQIFGKVRL